MRLLFIFALLLPLIGCAEVYKCQKDGKTAFSDKPCAGGAKETTMDIKFSPVTTQQDKDKVEGELTSKDGKQPETAEKKRRNVDKQVKTRLINDDIYRAEARMRQLNIEMEKELAALQQSKKSSNNNLAGATRDNAIANEMQAVTAKYTNKITVEKNEIDRLQKERDALKDN